MAIGCQWRCSVGLRASRGSCSSLFLSSKPQLGLDSLNNLWEERLDWLGQVGGGWMVASLVSVPVDLVGETVSTNVGVAALHHHDLGVSNLLHGSLNLLNMVVLSLKVVSEPRLWGVKVVGSDSHNRNWFSSQFHDLTGCGGDVSVSREVICRGNVSSTLAALTLGMDMAMGSVASAKLGW